MGYLIEIDPLSQHIRWPQPIPEQPETVPDIDPLPAQIDFTAFLESGDTKSSNQRSPSARSS